MDSYQSTGRALQPSVRTYNFLLRLSRRLGNVATYASYVMYSGSVLTRGAGIAFSSPQQLFANTIQQDQAIKDSKQLKKEILDKADDLKKIVSQSHEILMSANTVFPMSLFPDTVTVDRTKVTITRRDFFWSSDVMSFRIEDVLNVAASTGPLFGSLTIASRVMSSVDHFKITNFWRSDAIKLKQIIQGYVIAQHNKIDTAHLDKRDLIETLMELGHDSNR
jgi:hypothetical protein